MRALVLRSKRAFETYLELLESVRKEPYDSSGDPEGELFWRRQLSEIAQTEPLRLELSGAPDNEKVVAIVETIIEQFRHLIEDRRYSAELYRDDGSPRPEKAAQRFFFAVADCYCKANNLDVTPEADTGAGTVDFKFSTGYKCRITVEIKLSTNSKLVSGFENQITAYSIAEDAAASFYVVIDVGRLGRKDQELQKLRNEWKMQTKLRPELKFVDGKLRPSASRR